MASLEPITIPVNSSQIQMAIGQVNKLENQLVRLEKARQRGIITEQQYDKALANVSKRMNRFAVDTQQAEKEIIRFGNAIKGANIQTLNNLGRGLQESQKGFARFGLAAQQAGYQVGDFFVQIASGTSPMVAFTQQFAQLAGFFGGPWGAVVGAVAAIGGAAYIAFTRASEGVETFQDSLDKARESLKEQEFELSVAQGGFASAEQKRLYDDLAVKIGELNILEAERAKIASMTYQQVGAALRLKDQEIVAQQAVVDGAIETIRAMSDAADEAERFATEQELLKKGLSQSTIEAMKLAGIDLANISDAALNAQILAANLGISVGLASEIGRLSEMSPGERSVYTGVKTGALPPAALNSIGLGGAGFTTDANAPIEMPGAMPDNPAKPRRSRGGAKTDVLANFQKQLELERELLGTSEAYQKVRRTLGDTFKTTNPEIVAGLVQQQEEINKLVELEKQRKQVMDSVKSSLEDGFMSMVDGTKSVKDAFKSMAAEILKELYRVLVIQRLVGAISGAVGGSTGFLGLTFGGANASGGSMIPGRSYLVGENGPELVIPRHSGTVVNANQTANAAGGSGGVTVQNNITVTGSDAAMVRAEVAKMIPQITNATKAAVIDARLRGGQMKAAFS